MVVALDVSLSMAAQDTTPNRMLATQTELAALLDRMSGDRVGLVIYAGEALVRFPLTRDLKTARAIIDTMRPGERALRPGTDVAAAITQSLALLETTPARTRVILLVGDGESLSGDALAAARVAAAADVHIFTAGAGSEAGATIPVVNRNTGQTVDKIDARQRRAHRHAARQRRPGGARGPRRGRFVASISRARSATSRRLRRAGGVALRGHDGAPPPRAIPDRAGAGAGAAAHRAADRGAGPPARVAGRGARALALAATAPVRGLLVVAGSLAAACGDFAAERNAAGTAAFDEGRFDDAATAYREALAASPATRGWQ